MKITTHTTLSDYRRLLWAVYKKRYILLTGGAFTIAFLIGSRDYFWGDDENFNPITPIVSMSILIVYFYIRIMTSSKASYNSNRRLQETITWDIEGPIAKISGNSFNSSLDLTQSHKIVELADWFLLYENNTIFHFIPKKCMTINEIEELKQVFRNLRGVPNISLYNS